LDYQHRKKLIRYKDEYTHNIEKVKDRLCEIKRGEVKTEEAKEDEPNPVMPVESNLKPMISIEPIKTQP